MEEHAKAMLSAVLALFLVVVLIVSATLLGFAPTSSQNINPGASGTLSILLTDPPTVPQGVTAVYVSYSNVQIHALGFPSNAGWVSLGSSGTVETLGLVNVSQTISSANVPSGRYDELALQISGVTVQFFGRNYTAEIKSDTFFAPLVGELTVNASGSSSALVDFQPIVLNLGGRSNPEFALSAFARALQIPPGQAHSNSQGSRQSFQSQSWYSAFTNEQQERLTVSSSTLNQSAFSVTVENGAEQPVGIRMIIITPAGQGPIPGSPVLMNSAVLLVEPDGSLKLAHVGATASNLTASAQNFLNAAGYEVQAGASVTLQFSGSVVASFPDAGGFGGSSGAYTVTIIGDQVLASFTVRVQS